MQSKKIKSIKYKGKQRVVDIEVDHPSHIFYGNGIATSNSHAVSYAYNSYLSAYMKSHFPVSFFTSYLYYARDKQKGYDEVKLLVNNAKAMGIDLFPPDFRHNNLGFKRFPKQNKNATSYDLTSDFIRFGLCNIKGVGENKLRKFNQVVSTVESYLGREKKDWGWMDYLIHVSQNVDSTINEGFMETGCLDYFGLSRNKMLFEYKEFSSMTNKEVAYIKQNFDTSTKISLYSILSECILKGSGKGTAFANKNRLEKVKSVVSRLKSPPYSLIDSPEWIARVEEARLGVSLTCSILDACKNQDQANCTIKEFLENPSKKNGLFLAAQIDEVKLHFTKAKKEEMAFMSISDNDSQLDCVIFPSSWESIKNKGVAVVENCVMVSGSRSKDTNSLIVNDIFQLS